MSKQYPGGLITKNPVVPSGSFETSTASGIWTLEDQAYWAKLGQWPTAGNVPPSVIDFLVIAGGGSGGNQSNRGAGGGAAGGYRTSYGTSGGGGAAESPFSFTPSTNYTVTVGAGGAAMADARNGNKGSPSVFNAITSDGGGAGCGTDFTTPLPAGSKDGGSGGGANGYSTGSTPGTGTANQGFNGGTGRDSYGPEATGLGGGGGGAGAVGVNSTGTSSGVAGAGGAGVASTITGASVTRAGGGGGSCLNNGSGGQTPGAGGTGGGGAGANDSAVPNGTAGTINTGSGGGGGNINFSGVSGAGGSGIVILRYPSSLTITIGAGLTGTTATDGSYKVTTFTAGTGNVSWA